MEREREGGETLIGCPPPPPVCTSTGHRTLHWPWLGIEPVAFWCMNDTPTNWIMWPGPKSYIWMWQGTVIEGGASSTHWLQEWLYHMSMDVDKWIDFSQAKWGRREFWAERAARYVHQNTWGASSAVGHGLLSSWVTNRALLVTYYYHQFASAETGA